MRKLRNSVCVRLAGRDQDVVRPGLAGQADIGARRAGLSGGVRVVDDDRLLVAVVHLLPDPELLHRVEPVEGRRPLGVEHRHEALRAVAAGRSGEHPAGLVRMVAARVRNDLVVELAG